MASRQLPGLGLNGFWTLGEDGWNTGADQNWTQLSVLVQCRVLDIVASLPGSPTNGDVYILDETAGGNANKIALRDNGAWVYLSAAEGFIAYSLAAGEYVTFNGAVWAILSTGGGGGNDFYDFGFVFEDTPDASAIVGRVRIGRDILIPANFAGSSGGVSTNPAATFDVDVKDDGASIGTISVSTGGALTFTTSGGTSKTVAAGSEITFVAPVTPDTTVVGMSAVILATADGGS